MLKDILLETAEKYGLDYVQTTEGSNGYPKGLRHALIGFADPNQIYDVAHEIQDELGDNWETSIEVLQKKDGHALYQHSQFCGHVEGYDLTDRGLIDVTPSAKDEHEYIKVVSKMADDIDFPSLSACSEFFDLHEHIWQMSEKRKDGEVVVAPFETYPFCDTYHIETDKPLVMQYHDDDVTFHAFGLVFYHN
jgi:hypothetical protein